MRRWSLELKHDIALTAALTNSQAALAEKAATEAQEKIDAQALPIRTYLDQTVVPILLQGLSDLVKQRCVFVIVCMNVVSHEQCTFLECIGVRGRGKKGTKWRECCFCKLVEYTSVQVRLQVALQ